MSRESLQAFMRKITSDTSLTEEVKACVENKAGQEALDAFVKTGVNQGFSFTAEEVREFFKEREQELNDKELDSVTGGGSSANVLFRLGGTAIPVSRLWDPDEFLPPLPQY